MLRGELKLKKTLDLGMNGGVDVTFEPTWRRPGRMRFSVADAVKITFL